MRVEQVHLGHILGTGAVVAPVLGVFAPNFLAPLAILLVVALIAFCRFRGQSIPPLDRSLTTVVVLTTIWSGVSLFWTIDVSGALEKWLAVFVFAPLALVASAVVSRLTPDECKTVGRAALAGILAGIFLILLEVSTGGFISRVVFPGETFTLELFNRLPSVLLIFIWPAVAVLWSLSRLAAVAMLGVGVGVGSMLPNESAFAGFCIGIVAFVAGWIVPNLTRTVLATAMALGILVAPVMSFTVLDPEMVREKMPHVNPSLLHRLQIWEFTSRHIVEQPLRGWGFNSARRIPGGNERYLVKNIQGVTIGQGDRLPLHPHNGALQVWLELGFPGALALAVFLALMACRAGTIPDPGRRAAAFGMLSTIVPVWLFSFGVWQGWWLGVLILATLLMAVPLAAKSPE